MPESLDESVASKHVSNASTMHTRRAPAAIVRRTTTLNSAEALLIHRASVGATRVPINVDTCGKGGRNCLGEDLVTACKQRYSSRRT